MNKTQPRWFDTRDGTLTLKDDETGELFHNSQGAFTEAIENYVRPARLETLSRLKRASATSRICVRLLDPFFGLGYNTYAFLEHIARTDIDIAQVEVIALELDHNIITWHETILRQDCFSRLNAARLCNMDGVDLSSFMGNNRLDNGNRQTVELELPNRSRTKAILDLYIVDTRVWLEKMKNSPSPIELDLIFHDPFSPARVPQLWTIDIFETYGKMLEAHHGCILTYSCATAVRGALRKCGLELYRTAAVGKKSGGTAALTTAQGQDSDVLLPLRQEELARLATRSATPYRDPSFKRSRLEILETRQLELSKWE
jgi:hypothetical protein